MAITRKQPIGIELVKRGIVSEIDIDKALKYQRANPGKKIGDILSILGLGNPERILETVGEILDEDTILLTSDKIKLDVSDYISIDSARMNKAVPFEINGSRVKVCFADTSNKRAIETVRLLLLNKGLVMEKYITFESNIDLVLSSLEGSSTDRIDENSDVTALVDSIIKTGMKKRASDIHFEPMESSFRIRYRIDGKLITEANLRKDKQSQIIGRLKAISNMHQEKQTSQDGRIIAYSDYNIRVSSQPNIYGEKFVLRLLKKKVNVMGLGELGYPEDEEFIKKSFDKRNSITVIAAPTGEGKTTTLYSIINFLNQPDVNITTIEDPVEIRIKGLNQIEIDAKTSFSDALRTVLRQDPNIILVGEIRDNETAEIAMQSGQTGHYVLTTIHTIDSVEVITRLRKMGISNYDIASTLATSVSQRLVRRVCPHCAKEREFTDEEKEIMTKIMERYGEKIDFKGKKTYDIVGCKKCNGAGYFGRIAANEVLVINDELRELIVNNVSSIDIRKEAIKHGYKPLVVDGIKKVLNGYTTLDELNNKLVMY